MARELYDYSSIPIAIAQHNKTLTVSPNITNGIPMRELGKKDITVLKSVDGLHREVIDWSGGAHQIWIELNMSAMDVNDAQTLLDFWFDADYGDGPKYSWYLSSPDGHTYVVVFDQDTFPVNILRGYVIDGRRGFGTLRLWILGKVSD